MHKILEITLSSNMDDLFIWKELYYSLNWNKNAWTMKNNIIVMELKLYKISVHFNFICIFNKGFPGPDSKESAFSAGDQGSIPGFGRYPGEWQPTQKFLLENSMDRGAWWATCSPWGCPNTNINNTWVKMLASWRKNSNGNLKKNRKRWINLTG